MATTSLWLYRFLIHTALPVVIPSLWLNDWVKAKKRPSFSARMRWSYPVEQSGGIWVQAVSVGEVELARRLISEIRKHNATLPLLVTATTATGLALAQKTLHSPAVTYPCPFDLPGPTRRVFEAFKPRALTLIETEIWPEMLHQSSLHRCPVVIINARLSETSFQRYRRFGKVITSLLAPLSLVLARDDDDRDRFIALGVSSSKVLVGGNLKYDLEPPTEDLEWRQQVLTFAAGRPIIVAGSTMEGEESMIIDAFKRLQKNDLEPFLILAPRHPERFDKVARLLEAENINCVRRSRINEDQYRNEGHARCDVFLIDTIGELSRAYSLARVAFIGGSLVGTGGHNPLEASTFSVPVLSGPDVHNFAEIYRDLFAAGGAFEVNTVDDLGREFSRMLNDEDAAHQAGEIGHQLIVANRGATSRAALALLECAGIAKT